jgi:hypothetical protein
MKRTKMFTNIKDSIEQNRTTQWVLIAMSIAELALQAVFPMAIQPTICVMVFIVGILLLDAINRLHEHIDSLNIIVEDSE